MAKQSRRRVTLGMVILLATVILSLTIFTLLAQADGKSLSNTLTSVSGEAVPVSYLPIIFSPREGPCYYVETNDAVVIEIESVPLVADWQLETAFAGYTGAGYYVWRGPNYFAEPGHGILTYPISLTKSSDYRLNIRNSHPMFPSDYNDVWVRLDDGPWIKGFSNIVDAWTYDFSFDQGGVLGAAVFKNVSPGLHTLQLSGRSFAFRLDRLVLSANGMGQLDDWPESPCVVP